MIAASGTRLSLSLNLRQQCILSKFVKTDKKIYSVYIWFNNISFGISRLFRTGMFQGNATLNAIRKNSYQVNWALCKTVMF